MSTPRDLLELYVLPGLAGLLPWSYCYRLYRRLAKIDALYKLEIDAAVNGVRTFTSELDIKKME